MGRGLENSWTTSVGCICLAINDTIKISKFISLGQAVLGLWKILILYVAKLVIFVSNKSYSSLSLI